jgi:tRNA A58 N-methylase Trm61
VYLVTFDVVGAGTGSGQGTISASINPKGEVTGTYIDANNASHGFLRTPDGAIARFNVPDAGKGSGQGTISNSINPNGEVTGYYVDANNASHGFLRDK